MIKNSPSDLDQPSPLTDGIYSVKDVAQLTGFPAAKLRRWLSGRRETASLIEPQYSKQAGELWYVSFLDMVELKLVGDLRKAGVPMRKIRKAHESGRELLGVSHPFASQDIMTDGKCVLIRYKGRPMDLADYQYVMEKVIAPFLDNLSFDPESRLARSWRVHDGVVIDPRLAMGQPVAENSKVPTAILARAVDGAGGNQQAVAEWYEVSIDDVRHAVEFESRSRASAA